MSSRGERSNNGTLLGWELLWHQEDGIWSKGWHLKIKTLFFTFTIDNHGWFNIRRVYKPTKYSGGVDWSFWGKTISIDINDDYERGQTYYSGDARPDGDFGWNNRKAIWAEKDAERKRWLDMRDSHRWNTNGHDYGNGYCLDCYSGAGMHVDEFCPGPRSMAETEKYARESIESNDWHQRTIGYHLEKTLEDVVRNQNGTD